MSLGVVLDQAGRPLPPAELLAPSGLPVSTQRNINNGWVYRPGGLSMEEAESALSRAPAHVLEMLERSRASAGPFEARASMQSWRETIYAIIADGAQVLNTVTETIMLPDFTLPANYLYPGRLMKYTVIGEYSTVIATPGTITFALRWGGVAGTVLATSGAFAPDPTAANATLTCMVEWWFIARATGAAAASYSVGRVEWNDYDDASLASIVGNLNMRMAPASGSAGVNINTTTANALSPTVKFSVATATTQLTSHIAILEALT